MPSAGRIWTRWGGWLSLAAMAGGVALAALFLTRNVGYLFEADSPWMLQIPRSLEWDGEPGPTTPLRWTHPSCEWGPPRAADGRHSTASGDSPANSREVGAGPWPTLLRHPATPCGLRKTRGFAGQAAHCPLPTAFFVAGSWWPRLSMQAGEDALPVVTEAYQGGILYWPFKLVPRELRGRSVIRPLAAILGGFTLLLAFFVLRAWWGKENALLLTGLLACNSMFLLSFGFGYLYEALPMAAVLAAALACRKVRERPTAWGGLTVGFLTGLAGGLKLTALPAAMAVAAVLLGIRLLRRPVLATAFLVGLALPLLPFLVSEVAAGMAGLHSPLLSALGGGKGGVSDPAGLVAAFGQAGIWTAALPAGNGYILPMLSAGIAPARWLLGLSAVVGLPGLVLAIRRWQKGIDDPLRDAVLAAWAVVFVLSGLLYQSGFDFQAFMTIHPLAASLVAQSLLVSGHGPRTRRLRWAAWGAGAAFVAVVLVHTVLSFSGGSVMSTVASLTAQAEIAAAVPKDRLVVTTSYNQAGMLRMLSGGKLTEVNMDRLLSPGGTEGHYRLTVRHAFSEVIRELPDALYLFDLAPLPIDESREHTQFSRSISSRQVVAEEFVQAAREAGLRSQTMAVGHGDPGNGVYALVELRGNPGP